MTSPAQAYQQFYADAENRKYLESATFERRWKRLVERLDSEQMPAPDAAKFVGLPFDVFRWCWGCHQADIWMAMGQPQSQSKH
jgi:hypothetical protein